MQIKVDAYFANSIWFSFTRAKHVVLTVQGQRKWISLMHTNSVKVSINIPQHQQSQLTVGSPCTRNLFVVLYTVLIKKNKNGFEELPYAKLEISGRKIQFNEWDFWEKNSYFLRNSCLNKHCLTRGSMV